MDTYYGASAVGTFGSYVLGYFQQGDVAGQYFSYAWLFMNRSNNEYALHFEIGDQIDLWMLDSRLGNTENKGFVLKAAR